MINYKKKKLKESKSDIKKMLNLMEEVINADEIRDFRDTLIIANLTNWKQKDIQEALGIKSQNTITKLNYNDTIEGYWYMIKTYSPRYLDAFVAFVYDVAKKERDNSAYVLDKKPELEVA